MSTIFQNYDLETSCPAIKESSWLNTKKRNYEFSKFPLGTRKDSRHMVDFMVKRSRAIVNCQW